LRFDAAIGCKSGGVAGVDAIGDNEFDLFKPHVFGRCREIVRHNGLAGGASVMSLLGLRSAFHPLLSGHE